MQENNKQNKLESLRKKIKIEIYILQIIIMLEYYDESVQVKI